MLGLVTSKKGDLESKDTIKRRIDEAAKFCPLDQLALSTQCGFSSTVEGNKLTVEQQAAKLRLVVEVARDVWGSKSLRCHSGTARRAGPGIILRSGGYRIRVRELRSRPE